MDALARARPRTVAELQALKRIPRFSKNKRDLYGADIIVALQQARDWRSLPLTPWPPARAPSDCALAAAAESSRVTGHAVHV